MVPNLMHVLEDGSIRSSKKECKGLMGPRTRIRTRTRTNLAVDTSQRIQLQYPCSSPKYPYPYPPSIATLTDHSLPPTPYYDTYVRTHLDRAYRVPRYRLWHQTSGPSIGALDSFHSLLSAGCHLVATNPPKTIPRPLPHPRSSSSPTGTGAKAIASSTWRPIVVCRLRFPCHSSADSRYELQCCGSLSFYRSFTKGWSLQGCLVTTLSTRVKAGLALSTHKASRLTAAGAEAPTPLSGREGPILIPKWGHMPPHPCGRLGRKARPGLDLA